MLYICLWDANERLTTDTIMDKVRTITDTKTLWGEDPDKRNFQSTVLLAFAVLTFFGLCMDSKSNINRMFP